MLLYAVLFAVVMPAAVFAKLRDIVPDMKVVDEILNLLLRKGSDLGVVSNTLNFRHM